MIKSVHKKNNFVLTTQGTLRKIAYDKLACYVRINFVLLN